MNVKTIKKAAETINREIKFYERNLTYCLEQRLELEVNNGNLKGANFSNIESTIKKYEIVLADLATIKRAIKRNKTSVRIYGTAYNRGDIYDETLKVLVKAGFDVDSDGFGTLILLPIEDR